MEHTEFLKMLQEIIQGADIAMKIIAENTDPRSKEIGDRVILWDSSSLKFTEKEVELSELANKEAIVIASNLEEILIQETPLGNFEYTCDLKLRYPSGIEVFAASRHVKRTDNYER